MKVKLVAPPLYVMTCSAYDKARRADAAAPRCCNPLPRPAAAPRCLDLLRRAVAAQRVTACRPVPPACNPVHPPCNPVRPPRNP